MVITPHVLAGCLITACIELCYLKKDNQENYQKDHLNISFFPVVILGSLCSHFVLDAIPHYDYDIYSMYGFANFLKLFIDCLAVLTILVFAFWYEIKYLAGVNNKLTGLSPFILGIFTALLPDVINVGIKVFKLEALIFLSDFHNFFHSDIKLDYNIGFFTYSAFAFLLYKMLKICARELIQAIKLQDAIAEIDSDYAACFSRSNLHDRQP